MATTCVTRACCVLHRGEVFVREVVGTKPFRSVGNTSQLRIDHVEDSLTLLSATAVDACCGLLGVGVEMTLACVGDENLALGVGGETSTLTQAVREEVLFAGGILYPGDFLPFSAIVNPTNVSVSGLLPGSYSVTAAGLKILECMTVTEVSVIVVRPETVAMGAGVACDVDLELLYIGTNMFDGSNVRLRIPRVRFRPVKTFDWINLSDAQVLAFEGRVIQVEAAWYDIQRISVPRC